MRLQIYKIETLQRNWKEYDKVVSWTGLVICYLYYPTYTYTNYTTYTTYIYLYLH